MFISFDRRRAQEQQIAQRETKQLPRGPEGNSSAAGPPRAGGMLVGVELRLPAEYL